MSGDILTENAVSGSVYFIGAGPGDPELLTLKAQRLIAAADVIIYAGSLVNPAVLDFAGPDAEIYNSADLKLSEQVTLMKAAVQKGQSVARLHTGDPTVYGAVTEQMRELKRAGVSYEMVPGVSSAFAATAALGIELTVPEATQTIIFTRLAGHTQVPEGESLRALAAHHASLVLFLSVGMISSVVEELSRAGYAAATPVAVVYRASWPDQLVIRGTLADIEAQVAAAQITHQALIIVSPALEELSSEVFKNSHLYGDAMDTPAHDGTTAIIALTRQGTETGLKLKALLSHSVLYAPARFVEQEGEEGVLPYTVSVRQVLQSAFKKHRALICIMASGVVVRDLAPVLRNKHTDPAVVLLDPPGHYAVSLLSGHKGGGNRLARTVAVLLGGEAVVTTASDVQELPALDLLGEEQGWEMQRQEHLTAVIAALVNGDPVGVVQEAGDESWWPEPLPANLKRYATPEALAEGHPEAAALITCRRIPEYLVEQIPKTVVYRPRCFSVGVGCNRGTPAREIVEAVEAVFFEAGLDTACVGCVATIEDKADEDGLVQACELQGWPLRIFSREEIATVENLPNPSAWAERVLNVAGVAEPSALLASGGRRMLIQKHKFPNVTVAVAKIEDCEAFE